MKNERILPLLRILVCEKGYKQIAQKSGVPRESLYKMLAPGTNPSINNVIKIVRALDCDIEITNIKFEAPDNKKIRYSIEDGCPNLIKFWHKDNDHNFNPSNVYTHSLKLFTWQCQINEEHKWNELVCQIVKRYKKLASLDSKWANNNINDQVNLLCPLCKRH